MHARTLSLFHPRHLVTLALLSMVYGCVSDAPPPVTSRTPSVPVVQAPKPTPTPKPSAPTFGETYVVSRGDTLYSIAFRNQIDFRDLAEWNGIGSDYRIYVGQVLRLTPPGASRNGGSAAGPQIRRVPQGGGERPPAVATKPTPAPELPPALAGSGEWEWPTRGNTVLRGYEAEGNKGLDLGGEVGQVIVAARPGKVVYSGSALKGYGELIIIKHDEDYLTAYGYSRKRLVSEGDIVAGGQPIAELGVGPEQRPLLHFEIRNKGRPIDPLLLLPKR